MHDEQPKSPIILSFNEEWMARYWAQLSPSFEIHLNAYEGMEDWTVTERRYGETVQELNRVAAALPELATVPVTDDSQALASEIILLMSWLPMRSCIAALGWLHALSSTGLSWSYAIYVYSNHILSGAAGVPVDSELGRSASIVVQRIHVASTLKNFEQMFLQHGALRALYARLSPSPETENA